MRPIVAQVQSSGAGPGLAIAGAVVSSTCWRFCGEPHGGEGR